MTETAMQTRAEQHQAQRSAAAIQRHVVDAAVDVDSPLAQLQARANGGPHATALASLRGSVAQRVPANRTGLPDNLRSGLESLSGRDLSDIRVHYNSPKPAQLAAHAFAQGSEIHLAPGQERHLPHEGWHAVQQMEGRVRPTTQFHGTAINDAPALEREAADMGVRATRSRAVQRRVIDPSVRTSQAASPAQLIEFGTEKEAIEAFEKALDGLDQQKIKEYLEYARGKGWAELESVVTTHRPLNWWTDNFKPKLPIPRSDRNRSKEVPDLTNDLFNKIEVVIEKGQSKGINEQREKVLELLRDYLESTGVFNQDVLNILNIRYQKGSPPKGYEKALALTWVPTKGPNKHKILIDVYKGAYETPSILYSVLRHELVHAAQRTAWPDETKKKNTDKYLYWDPDGNFNEFQNPLAETEAYATEIDQLGNTGLNTSTKPADVRYRDATLTHLTSSAEDLITHLPGVKELEGWLGYLDKALSFVRGVKKKVEKNEGELFSQKSIDGLSEVAERLANVYAGKSVAIYPGAKNLGETLANFHAFFNQAIPDRTLDSSQAIEEEHKPNKTNTGEEANTNYQLQVIEQFRDDGSPLKSTVSRAKSRTTIINKTITKMANEEKHEPRSIKKKQEAQAEKSGQTTIITRSWKKASRK
jgi:hypothetical protein